MSFSLLDIKNGILGTDETIPGAVRIKRIGNDVIVLNTDNTVTVFSSTVRINSETVATREWVLSQNYGVSGASNKYLYRIISVSNFDIDENEDFVVYVMNTVNNPVTIRLPVSNLTESKIYKFFNLSANNLATITFINPTNLLGSSNPIILNSESEFVELFSIGNAYIVTDLN